MCLYDEENDDFYNDMIETIDDEELEIEYNTESQKSMRQSTLDFITLISEEISNKFECDRKKLKFKYNGVKYEAVPLKIVKNKCVFNILKPTNEQGLKMFNLDNIINE